MNSIKTLTLKNFQSHQKTTIEPAQAGKLTVIVGPSDTGKTVIVRALRWLLYNIPQGTDFIRVGCSFARVTAEFESGHTVIRERTKSKNQYKIITPGAEGPEFYEGFGSHAPREVQEITGVTPVKIGDDVINLNLSEQLDGPFLGTKQLSDPARAKVLGKMAGTEEIDLAGQDLGTDLYRRNQEKKRVKTEIDLLAEQVKVFDCLPAMKWKIERLRMLCEAVKKAQERKAKLEELRDDLQVIETRMQNQRCIVYTWRGLAEAEKSLNAARAMADQCQTLTALEVQLRKVREAIERVAEILHRWFYLPVVEKYYPAAEDALKSWKELSAMVFILPDIEREMKTAQGVIDIWKNISQADDASSIAENRVWRKNLLQDIGHRYLIAQSAIEKTHWRMDYYKGLPETVCVVAMIEPLAEKRNQLKKLTLKTRNMEEVVNGTELSVAELSVAEDTDMLRDRAAEKLMRLRSIERLKTEYSLADHRCRVCSDGVVGWENGLILQEQEYRNTLAEAGICPLCGTELDPKNINLREVV